MLMRKVAQAASAASVKSEDFEDWGPLKKGDEKITPSWSETSKEERLKIIEKLRKQK